MQVLIKKHRAKMVIQEGSKSIEILDDGQELSKEQATTGDDIIQGANFVSQENQRTLTINKGIRNDQEEFEIQIKYLVE